MKLTVLNKLSLLFGIILFISGCNSATEPGIAVTGQLENKGEGAVILNKYNVNGFEPVDTIFIGENNSFRFFVEVTEPEFFRLNFFGRQQVNFILDGSEDEVVINAHGTDANGTFDIIGSEQSNHLAQIDSLIKSQKQFVQDLNQKAIKARMDGNEETLKNVTDKYYESIATSQADLKNYFKNIAPSLAVFYGIGSLDPEQNFDFYNEIAIIYQDEVPNHPFTKDLVYQVATMRKLAIGQPAPEIALPSPDGDVLKLSSLKGNYVLVDFWAAWCRPCRAENPNVVRMYNEYSDKNFEILGVSLDRNRDAWLKAINDDGLKWKHVSDLKYFNSEAAADYKINAIPATYLIGPDGEIIAKNLRGPSLEAKLKEIFG